MTRQTWHSSVDVSMPSSLYLRHETGAALGPMPRRHIELLFDSRVVDDGTPVSEDGIDFSALREWPQLWARMLEVKEMLGLGEDPWADEADDSGPSVTADLGAPFLRVLLETAANKQSGHLTMSSAEGELELTFKDGNITAIEPTIESMSLERYLLEQNICDAAAIEQAKERAPAMGGDLGAALISLGSVQPHEWFETLLDWARGALTIAAGHAFNDRSFEVAEIPPPPVPLGMDRLGIGFEIVRRLAKDVMQEALAEKLNCPVIPSQVDGVSLEETKPKPKELRVLNAVDGVKTVQDILDSLGGNDDKNRPVEHALFFASQTGFVVFGDDPLLKKEREEALKLNERYARMRDENLFDILGITEKTNDEEVRTRYTEYAKQFHPDTLRASAASELIEARRQIFALIGESFEALETEDQRYQYAHDLDAGLTGNSEDLQRVQDTLQAETHFKKAEILTRVKKYGEAKAEIETAIGLNGEDVEFKIFRAYILFLLGQKGGEGKESALASIKTILKLMKNNANIASGYLYLGHLNKAAEKPEVAFKYFEKVLEYDEHHPEATREVRVARMRAEKKKKKKLWPL